jgi:predicted MPP superfamily phosphohydrolase
LFVVFYNGGTMLIRYCSDLHLEGFQDTAVRQETMFLPHDRRDSSAVLVLAGDICSKQGMLIEFLAQVESRFKKVIYVPGNHEYYGSEMCQWNREFRTAARTKLSNTYSAAGTVEYCHIDGVDFIFGTMWADGGRTYHEEVAVASAMADFHYIRFDDRLFKVNDMQVLHRYHISDIEHLLDRSLNKTVVVTHHLPSYRLCHPRFGVYHNGGFASNSDDILNLATYWIHGHTHDTIDTVLGNTRVVANPAGYNRETNRSQYNDFGVKFLEV